MNSFKKKKLTKNNKRFKRKYITNRNYNKKGGMKNTKTSDTNNENSADEKYNNKVPNNKEKEPNIKYNNKICKFCTKKIESSKPIYMSRNQSYCSKLCKSREEKENEENYVHKLLDHRVGYLLINKLLSEKKYDEVVIFLKKLDSEKRNELLNIISDDNYEEIVKAENKIVENTLNYIQGNYLPNIDRQDIINRYDELNSNLNHNLDAKENNSPINYYGRINI